MELKVSRGTSSNPPNGPCDSGRIEDITRDPTEPTLTEEAARRRTQLYSRLVNSLDCIVWEADARTLEFSFVSPQAERMLGYPAEQWLSPGFWAQHVHPEDVEWCTKFCIQATQQGQDHEFEYRMIAADGRTVWLHDVVSVQRAPHGPERLTGMMIDVTTRKVAETALKESEERFRQVFENSAAGMVISDASGQILRANKSFCDLVGFSEDELRERSILEITHAGDRESTRAYLEDIQRGRAHIHELEKRYVRQDGEVVWGRTSVVFLLPNGRAPYSIVVVQDITERKRAEELLRESEERFRAIFENAALGTSLVDRQGHVIKCNPAIQKMLGYTEQELRSMAFTTFTHPDDIDLDWELYRELVDGKRDKYEIEKRYLTKDGRVMWGQLTVSRVMNNKDGALADYTVGMVEDITERKRAEELLRESEERFRTIFENAGLGTALVDRLGHPIKCNPALQKMLGFTEQELRSMAFTEFTHPDDIDLDWRLYSDLVDGKRDKYEIEKRYLTKDGRVMWGQLTVSRVKSKDGAPAEYMVGMVEDITERKRAEGQLKTAHDQLTKELAERTLAEAEIARLSVSLINAQEEERTRIARELHDNLSQQIAGLGIALSNIKRQIPEDRREAREQAERAYDRVLAIGEGVRYLSHQLHPAILEHSGLVAALESYCTEFESLTKVNATIQAEGTFDDLSANATLGIFRIAQEALQNVWKHSGVREAGICLARAREHMRLQISDRGIGFDPTQPSKEAGLGLVSMRERAKLLGGTLTVESSARRGTTIIVDIPVSPAPLAKTSE
jgi:PAS domain S-box-containing protein